MFYLERECYDAQIEGRALINFRFGYTCFGFAPYPSKWYNKPFLQLPWWTRNLPHLSLRFIFHSAQADQWYIFEISYGKHSISYLTKGEKTNKSEYGFMWK